MTSRRLQGHWLIVALRWLLVLAASAPAWLVAWSGVSDGPARAPYYTDVVGRLPVIHFTRLLRDLPEAYVPAALASVVLGLLGSLLLTAGTLAVLDPQRPPTGLRALGGDLWRGGTAHLAAFLRIGALEIVLIGLGLAALGAAFGKLDTAGDRAGWTGYTLVVALPRLKVLASVAWLAIVGAWGWTVRGLTVADGRRRVRRTGLVALRLWGRHPARGPLLFVAVTLGVVLASGALVVAWRQDPPGGLGGVAARVGAWWAVLVLHAWVWLWLQRLLRSLLEAPTLAAVRQRPDDALGLGRAWATLRRLWA